MSTAPFPRKPVLSATCATHIVQDGLNSTVLVLLPVLAQTFGLSYAQVGLLRGAGKTAHAGLELASGWLSERVGEARLLAVGLGLTGAGYAALAFAPGVAAIVCSLLLVGAGAALHHAPSSALIATAYGPKGRSGALGVYNASGDVGKLAFTAGFSLAAGAGLAWRETSLVYGAVAMLAAAALAMVARTSLRRARPEADAAATAGGWGVLDRRAFAALLLVSGVDTAVQSGVLVFTAFLMLAKGFSLPVATGAAVALLAGGVFGKALCGFLADRVGARRAFALVQVLTALGLVGLVVAPNWLTLALLLPLGAVVQGSTSITYGFAAGLIHPARMARGYALLYASGTFTAVLCPIAFGWIADARSVATAFLVMALLALLSIPAMLTLRAAPAPRRSPEE